MSEQPRKPPVGLEFQLTPLYLQANPEVNPDYAYQNKEVDPPKEEPNVVHLPPENPLLNFDEAELMHMQKEAFLWGFASGLLVAGTLGLLWMMLTRN